MEAPATQSISAFKETPQMPMLFLGHGNPMYAIEHNEFTNAIRSLRSTIPRPGAILSISAHWQTRGTLVTAMPQPRTIHDFGGFPPELFAVHYPAAGSPELATMIKGKLTSSPVGLDTSWGLDHGTWSVLRHLYPAADVPVVQISLDFTKSADLHYQLAEELAPLRKKGVLIVASGNMVHNLSMIDWQNMNTIGHGYEWAVEAQAKMNTLILNRGHQQLIDYTDQGRAFQLAIPTPEHFLPLLYILALTGENETISLFNDKAVGGSLSMTSVAVGM